jgi:hypothetical protein
VSIAPPSSTAFPPLVSRRHSPLFSLSQLAGNSSPRRRFFFSSRSRSTLGARRSSPAASAAPHRLERRRRVPLSVSYHVGACPSFVHCAQPRLTLPSSSGTLREPFLTSTPAAVAERPRTAGKIRLPRRHSAPVRHRPAHLARQVRAAT